MEIRFLVGGAAHDLRPQNLKTLIQLEQVLRLDNILDDLRRKSHHRKGLELGKGPGASRSNRSRRKSHHCEKGQ